MEALVEVGTIVTGVAVGVVAARAVLTGILAVTFGRGAQPAPPAFTAKAHRA